jgi:quercetin dioxygenase-like cupin family protein
MRAEKLREMSRGWFVGDFQPTALATDAVEAAVKEYRAGDVEPSHFHKIATEVTVIVTGEVEMNGNRYVAGDIIVIEPGEATDFRAITDVLTVVVKTPGAKDDKYLSDDAHA